MSLRFLVPTVVPERFPFGSHFLGRAVPGRGSHSPALPPIGGSGGGGNRGTGRRGSRMEVGTGNRNREVGTAERDAHHLFESVAFLDTSTGPPRPAVEVDAQGNSRRPRLTFFHLADRATTPPGTIPC
jgi:hypothetical protein